jgi:hypothetical protein
MSTEYATSWAMPCCRFSWSSQPSEYREAAQSRRGSTSAQPCRRRPSHRRSSHRPGATTSSCTDRHRLGQSAAGPREAVQRIRPNQTSWPPCQALASMGQGPRAGLLIVLVPGFGRDVCLLCERRRAALPGVPGCAPAPTAPGWFSFRAAGAVGAGQAGAGRAHSRCQQVRNASFHGQPGLILRMRWRAWCTRRAGMCQIR